MSARTARLLTGRLLEATLDAVWRQWRAIGGPAAGGPVRTQVDPEALCLASLALESKEPRLWVAMSDWLRLGASLVSVQRLKNLRGQFPDAQRGVSRLASVALEEAKDARWRSLLSRSVRGAKPRERVRHRSAEPALTAAPALVLRLRAAFTVGVKADLLAFLLGQPYRASVAAATDGLGYSTPTIFRALQDLHDAGFVQAADLPTAAEYWVDTVQWHGLLGGSVALIRWGFWREILRYVCAAVTWEEDANRRGLSEYAAVAGLRDLARSHEADLARAGVLDPGAALPQSPALAEWRQFHKRLAERIASG